VGLHLITGPARSGKLERALSSLSDGESSVVLVPSAAEETQVRARLLARGLAVPVSRFDRFCEDLWGIHGDGRRYVQPEQRTLLVRRAAATQFSDDVARGAARAAERSAVSLAQSGSVATPSSDTDRRFMAVVDAYFADLAELQLVEPGEAMRLLADSAPAPAEHLVLVGFSDLEPAQRALVASWRRSAAVTLTLPYVSGRPATSALSAIVESLKPADEESAMPPSGDPRELVAFCEGLFDGAATLTPGGAVVFGTAAGDEAEAALIADEVTRALDAGAAPERVAIAWGGPWTGARRLIEALEARGVPVDSDISLTLTETPYGRAFTALLEAAIAHATGTDDDLALGTLATTPFFDADSDQIDAALARRRRRRCSSAALWHDLTRLAPNAGRALREAGELARKPVAVDNADAWQAVADRLLRAGMVGGRDRRPHLTASAAAHKAICGALSTLVGMDGGQAPADLATALTGVRVASRDAGNSGGVRITEPRRLRSGDFHTVVVGAMTNQAMPAVPSATYGSELEERLIAVETPDRAARARLDLYLVASRATERLVFTRTLLDSAAKPVRPSPLWEELLDRYREPGDEGALEGTEASRSASLSDLPAMAPFLRPERRRLRQQAARRRVPELVLPRAELTDEQRRELASLDTFSPSAIATYIDCPYRWFHDRMLRPGELDAEVDGRRVGTIAHEVLAEFYSPDSIARYGGRVTGSNAEAACAEVRELATAKSADARPESFDERLALRALPEHLAVLIQADARLFPNMRPIAVEEVISASLGDFTLEGRVDRLDGGDDGIIVTDYKLSRVASQKSWTTTAMQIPLYMAALRAGGRPVIGAAYRSIATGENRILGPAKLIDSIPESLMKPATRRGDATVETEDLGTWLEPALVAAREAVGGIRAGDIHPAPRNPDACRYCCAQLFCSHRSSAASKEGEDS
jgi:RecB family exonuclease